MNNYFNNNLWYDNLNLLINLKENETVMLRNNNIYKDERYVIYFRKTEDLKILNYIVKKSFFSIIINILLKKRNLLGENNEENLFNSLNQNEDIQNSINFLIEANKGLIRLSSYYKKYNIQDYNLLIDTYYNILDVINNINNVKQKSIKYEEKENEEKENEEKENEEKGNEEKENEEKENEEKENSNNSKINENEIINNIKEISNITNEKNINLENYDNSIHPIYSSELKNSYYLEEDIIYSNDKHRIKKFIVEDQPYSEDIVGDKDFNPNRSYYNSYHNFNTRSNFYERTSNPCYTIPVFYSINDISKNIKNTIVRIFNKVYNSIKKIF